MTYRKRNDELIKTTKMILLIAGYWKKYSDISDNAFFIFMYKIYGFLVQSSQVLLTLSLVVETIRLFIGDYERAVALQSLGISLTASRLCVKFLIFQKNNLLDLYDDVTANEEEIWESDDLDIRTTYNVYVVIARWITFMELFLSFVTVFFMAYVGITSDLEMIKYNKLYNATLESQSWYQIWFPDKLNHLGWVYFLKAVSSWDGILYNTVTYIVVSTLLLFEASQLHIFRIQIGKYDAEERLSDADKLLVLKRFAKRHIYLINYAADLNNKLKYVLMIEFSMISLDIASISVTLTQEMSPEHAWHLVFFILLVLQLIVTGLSANEVKFQSEKLANGMYHSNWHLLNKEGFNIFYFMLMRAQKPLMMTIGPFGPMTSESVVKVLRAAYCYVSIMKD